jgi:hypothetical protein
VAASVIKADDDTEDLPRLHQAQLEFFLATDEFFLGCIHPSVCDG